MSADLFAEFSSTSASTQPSDPFGSISGSAAQDRARAAHSPGLTVGVNANSLQLAPQWSTSQNSSNRLSGSHQLVQNPPPSMTHHLELQDDVWGDFEVAEQASNPPPSIVPEYQANSALPNATAWGSHDIEAGLQQRQRKSNKGLNSDIISGSLLSFESAGASEISTARESESFFQTQRENRANSTSSDPNVLFDADDFVLRGEEVIADEFDDFGDFETVGSAPETEPSLYAVSNPAIMLDLLELDSAPFQAPADDVTKRDPLPSAALPRFGTTTSKNSQSSKRTLNESKSFETGVAAIRSAHTAAKKTSATSSSKKLSVSPLKMASDDDDWAPWDDFSGGGESGVAKEQVTETPTPTKTAESWGWNTVGDGPSASVTKDDDDSPPPMNVPPPAILLGAFPELLNRGHALFRPVSSQGTSIKEQVLSNPRTVEFLQGYLLIATTAARIIAGRKHRWRRDRNLAKSMSISAAGSKGMKLAGLDKTQSAREDRETVDVLAAWKEHVGKLRSAVATANSVAKVYLRVPELAENFQIQTAKMGPTASKSCIICGLGREERITRVDFDVEDSFGEWWVDHWGHRACKNFWIQHEERLRQR
ncbi:uncharacterized protein UV8b_03678 [Ustilaginoidea virens]|uniref:Uncharacterized protein n=1 Tax=Ustilaginoidea virens TaxID=1159556 RepID=A0A063C4J0_USTVR|nr:uncharacterized protein UV8b_03678 [Ustilaginoidea virens]QUC19437.1 hypothetical protein UV8b_03678 [Ustilaginoidea virens]GAO13261.1 hypothetical protein UVI_02026070 [Ustilaginoidea virens]